VPVVHDPVAFHIAGLTVRWYGLFILAGILVGLQFSRMLAARRGLDPEFVLDMAPLVIVAAVIGARVYYLLLRNHYYRSHPHELISLQLQGLTIHGALVAGIATFVWLCRRRGEPVMRWADVVIAAVPIGQMIGRWGNWANQEAFGTPTSLPWAVHIDLDRRPPEYAQFATFHPTFLYEGLLDLLIAAVLIQLLLKGPGTAWFRDGDVLGCYLILYGIARLIVEHIRTDSLMIGPLPAAYWLSGALVVAGTAVLSARRIGPLAGRPSHAISESGAPS
jgi:phosphatidylglycerol:prolipoprotein diacylglycerol transferase